MSTWFVAPLPRGRPINKEDLKAMKKADTTIEFNPKLRKKNKRKKKQNRVGCGLIPFF